MVAELEILIKMILIITITIKHNTVHVGRRRKKRRGGGSIISIAIIDTQSENSD